jgi:hypothetical protein
MKSLTSRTSLITAVAVAGVLVAGTAAIAANIGILNSTDDSSIGSLSATDDLVDETSTTSVATTLATTTTTSLEDSATNAGDSYVVDDAGVVTLSSASGNLALVSVVPQPGWTVTSTQPDAATLEVSFTNGVRTLVFSAVLGPDGVVTADVVEPVDVVGAPAASPQTSSPTTTIDDDHSDDDGYEYDDDDDDEYDDDDHDDDEYDDDDHDDEYEGADDDD